MTATPPMPPEVAAVFARWPGDLRTRALALRDLIFTVAAERGAGPLTETLKWGEPAYLTEATKSGSTIRLGQVRGHPGVGLLFNCRTTLVEGFRRDFPHLAHYDGTRALVPDHAADPDMDALALCIGRALTYHRTPSR